MKRKNKILLASTASLSLTALSLKNLSDAVFKHYFVATSSLEKDISAILPAEILDLYNAELDEQIAWFTSCNRKEYKITSFDGLLLDGMYVETSANNKFMILVHGMNSDRYILLKQAYEFAKMGYNLLLIDQRGYGASEGHYVTFGLKESIDLLQWIKETVKLYPNAQIGLYGVSMGASTILMTLNSKLPTNISFAIADSAYTSLNDIMDYSISLRYPLLRYPLLKILNLKIKHTLGFEMTDVDPLDSLSMNNKIPVLFIHSQLDRLVPYEMSLDLYDICKTTKAFIIEDNEYHAYACYQDRDYFKKINSFIKKIETA